MPTHPTTHKRAEAVHQIDEPQADALRLAEMLTADEWPGHVTLVSYAQECVTELLRQHARITELESQLAQRFDAADMATAAAQGFRDGVAPLSANAGEPVAWLYESPMPDGSTFTGASTERLQVGVGTPAGTIEKPLYLAAPPTAQAEGWISVQDELPKCSKKPDSFGVEVLIWPPHEDGSRTAFYGRRQSREPNFYKYGALLGHVEFWRYPPPPPTSAEVWSMGERMHNVPIGAHFILKRTGDRYELLDIKHDTPGGTQYVVRRSGFTKPTTLHRSCHVEIIKDTP